MPVQSHPDLLVGFSSGDDAGVFRLPDGSVLVQTMDFFTPIVDDPYAYGQIAAANALSDVYAMGGHPLTVMNIACFDPTAAPPEIWANVLLGMADKTAEAGAVVVGGHSVEDKEPKFGMSVTGLVKPDQVLTNATAKAGQKLAISKPLGTGIVTTAAKFDKCSEAEISAAISAMTTLNKSAMEAAHSVGATCATDVTGFGLLGHLGNITRESGVRGVVDLTRLPTLPGVERMVAEGCLTGGAGKNQLAMGERLMIPTEAPYWLVQVALDPQSSGGLLIACDEVPNGFVEIGCIESGHGEVELRSS